MLKPNADAPVELGKAADHYPKPDNELTFDKLGSVFPSGNATRDDAPNHVRIQTQVQVFAQTWVSMPPGAGLLDSRHDQMESGESRRPRHRLQLRPVRCDHRQGRPPHLAEGGDGPLYQET